MLAYFERYGTPKQIGGGFRTENEKNVLFVLLEGFYEVTRRKPCKWIVFHPLAPKETEAYLLDTILDLVNKIQCTRKFSQHRCSETQTWIISIGFIFFYQVSSDVSQLFTKLNLKIQSAADYRLLLEHRNSRKSLPLTKTNWVRKFCFETYMLVLTLNGVLILKL